MAIDGVSMHVRIVGDNILFFFLLFCLVQKVHVENHIDVARTNLIVLANEWGGATNGFHGIIANDYYFFLKRLGY